MSSNHEVLLLTCPSGKQCSHLLPLLYNEEGKGDFKLRLAAHSQASVKRLTLQYPEAEVVQSDLSDQRACLDLLRGATAAFVVLPSLHSREKEMGLNLVDAAVAETQRPGSVFRHFVLSSVLGTQIRGLMQHDIKSYVEERLYLSPTLNWTILKPTNFMDTFYPVAKLAGQEKPVVEKLLPAGLANSLIALRDLAEASAKVLKEREAHYFAEYPLCSTMPVSAAKVGEEIGRQIGKRVEIRTPDFETRVERLLSYIYGGGAEQEYGDRYSDAGLAAEGDLRGDVVRDEAEKLILFYDRRGIRGSPNVLRWLLGREPTGVEEWVRQQLE